ncbi:hypothetical protein ACFX5D_03690 [Flavobacterium sp. LB3P45]|uniref:Uncharacterized protein n=1 Tax=Flavobacterium fructosi TaxID=3230416 RepID=A0ABW6HJ79_9FLAO
MLLIVFGLIILLGHYGYFENKYRDAILNEEFSSRVISKYVNVYEHMTPMLKLSNGSEIINYFPKHKGEIRIGDSLLKRKKSTDMLVFRRENLVYSINLLDK